MVKRSVFYVHSGKLYRKDVEIEWDLGFDREAKQEYIERIQKAAGDNLSASIDVTTASPIYKARMLSPFYVKVDGMNVEDIWALNKEQQPQIKQILGAFDFIYLNALSREEKEYALRQAGFIDVFHNPDKAYNTQAKSLAVLQLLAQTDNLNLLVSLGDFVKWYTENCTDIL